MTYSTRASEQTDVLIIGSGIAGLIAALSASEENDEADILVVSKGPTDSSASYLAQGGIAAVTSPEDSIELHAADTCRVGRGLCKESAVEVLVSEAARRIADLRRYGVEFEVDMGLEGGHSRPRILHCQGAATGQVIAHELARRVEENPQIRTLQGERAQGLWLSEGRCIGVVTAKHYIKARATIMATGGMAALWSRTTNPLGSLGEGMTMAYRAGASLADLELIQFHPTALLGSGDLLSEALRGAGALLLDKNGERFVDELAPRDIVARAIFERGEALLDLRPIDRSRFPTLIQAIRAVGINPDTEPVPVAPAAHYAMGGIVVDLEARSDLEGLYAVGECSCTGVHGANRLASNSLLECVVFGHRAGIAALTEPALADQLDAPRNSFGYDQIDDRLRDRMWSDAGVIRNADGLSRLLSAPALLPRLVAKGALMREESRGGHYRSDFPREDPAWIGHIIQREGEDNILMQWA